MKRILEFQEFMDRESRTRTKGLNEEEFLEVFRENCKNFSFDNDMLWRNTNNFGDFGLFFENDRKGTIGTYDYKDFFDARKDYIVPRYKSLIGSTTKRGAESFGSDLNISKSSEIGALKPESYCFSRKSLSENSCFVFDRRAKSGEQLNTIFAPSKGITI